MKGTFNAYGRTSERFEGHIPVWLGVVSPLPIGGKMTGLNQFAELEGILRAGTPCHYDFVNKIFWAINPGQESEANCYLYNDVMPVDRRAEDADWTRTVGAVVMAHNEGLLISRIPGAEAYDIDALQAAVPNVILIREPLGE